MTKSGVKDESVIAARKAAELAVADMPSGPLKIAAFQTILTQFLQRELSPSRIEPSAPLQPTKAAAKRKRVGQQAQGTTARLLGLIDEGVFSEQRTLAEIRQTLLQNGWHYQLADLGTPLTRLVRRKLLRRTQVADGGKRLWKYSNY
jgi:hypothetical protein